MVHGIICTHTLAPHKFYLQKRTYNILKLLVLFFFFASECLSFDKLNLPSKKLRTQRQKENKGLRAYLAQLILMCDVKMR